MTQEHDQPLSKSFLEPRSLVCDFPMRAVGVTTDAIPESSWDAYAESYELAVLPLLVLSESGQMVCVNRAAQRLLRLPKDRLLGHPFCELVHPLERARVADFIFRAPETSSALDVRLVLHDREEIFVNLSMQASAGLPGVRHLALLGAGGATLLDVQAVIPNQLENRFMALLSHELRTPLTPVLAALALLRRLPELSDASREVVDLVRRNVELEAQLIDDLLDVTSLLRGRLHIDRHPIELQTLLQEAVRAAREPAAEKRVTLVHDASFSECRALGDAARLRQVFTILLSNALKFTPTDGMVSIRSWQREGMFFVEFQDTGIGFEPASATRLFDAFQRAERRSAANGGLGLGLAICKGLVELHGGQINATSSGPGKGACFTLRLPTLADSVGAGMSETQEYVEVTEITTVLRQRLLLVEDHADTAEILSMLLEEHGYAVIAADSIANALNVDLDCIDLVISDIGLPDGTGMELLQRLRETHDVPAIALSGFGMDSDVENSHKAGFERHLTKPVEFEQLLETVRALLELPTPRRQAAQAGH